MSGKAPPDRPAFQPYWGKPAVRNERGDRGNVGIMRSPVRASILPDHLVLRTVRTTAFAALAGSCVRYGRELFSSRQEPPQGNRANRLCCDEAGEVVLVPCGDLSPES